MNKNIVILDGNLKDKAVLNPSDYVRHMIKLGKLKKSKFPKYCILCFFKSFYKVIEEKYNSKSIGYPDDFPIHIFNYNGINVAFVYPTIGSSAGDMLEELIALGGKYFISIGGVGTIAPEIERGEIIIPTKAIRDEGVSFHYEKPSRFSYPSNFIVESIENTLTKSNVPLLKGATWTTHSSYRETRQKVLEFHKSGVLTVEMEASMFFSIAKFRGVDIGCIFIAGDCVANEKWNPRMKRKDLPRIESDRQKLLDYALETLISIKSSSKGG